MLRAQPPEGDHLHAFHQEGRPGADRREDAQARRELGETGRGWIHFCQYVILDFTTEAEDLILHPDGGRAVFAGGRVQVRHRGGRGERRAGPGSERGGTLRHGGLVPPERSFWKNKNPLWLGSVCPLS